MKKIDLTNSIENDRKRILSESTPFGVKEAYRSLYTNVLYLPIEDSCKKIVVTSTFSGEGKTTLSINLAITVANNSPESNILLIDADLRSPRLSSLFGSVDKSVHGLSEYLVGIDNEPNIVPTAYKNLFVLNSGASNVNSPGLLSSSKFAALMNYCADKFKYVIIDTPPVGIVSDAVLLNDSVNGYLVVTRSGASDVNSLSDTVKMLESVNAKIFGFVLTSYNAKGGAKYGRYTKGGYGKYGKYGKYSRYSNYEKGLRRYEEFEGNK